MAKITAIIDIGSNSIKLSIFEKTSRFAFFKIKEEKAYVRLGHDSYKNNNILDENTLEEAFQVLKEFSEIIDTYKVRKILCVATSALRDAPNTNSFKNKVAKEIGINIKIISGEREGFLTALGAINLLPHQENAVVLDIGGGSSEFTLIENGDIKESISLILGNIRLKDLYFDTNKKVEAKEFIKNELEKIPEYFKNKKLIITGGITKEISKIIMSEDYPLQDIQAYEYNTNENLEHIKNLSMLSINELKELGVSKQRLDTINIGASLFYYILKHLSPNTVQVSRAGLREGLFLNDLLRNSKLRFPHNFNVDVKSLMDRFLVDKKNQSYLPNITKKIFDLFCTKYDIKKYEKEVIYASKLLNIGKRISYDNYNKHSYNIILNELSYGLTHKEKILIATLVRFQNKTLLKNYFYDENKELLPTKDNLKILSFIISAAKCIANDTKILKDFKCYFKNEEFKVELKGKVLSQNCLENIKN